MVNWSSVPSKKVTGAIVCRTSLWRPKLLDRTLSAGYWATRRVAERDWRHGVAQPFGSLGVEQELVAAGGDLASSEASTTWPRP